MAWLGLLRVLIQAFLIARILRALGEESMLRTGIVALIVSMIGIGLSMDYLYVFAPLLFLAYGTGVIRPVLMSKLKNSVKKNETATLLGVNNSLTSIVHIITPIAGGFIIQYLPSQIVPILSVMFLFVLLFLARKRTIN